MDYWVLRKQAADFSAELSGKSFITKVFDLPGGGIGLLFKKKDGCRCCFLFSAGSEQGMVLSDSWEEPERKHRFSVQLDKLLHDAKVRKISVRGYDRLVEFQLVVKEGFFGKFIEYKLICEFTGRTGNILLLDSEGIVIELERNTPNNSAGKPYYFPVLKDTLDPFSLSGDTLGTVLSKPPAFLQKNILGFSPTFSREFFFRASEPNSERKAEIFSALLEEASRGEKFYLYLSRASEKQLPGIKGKSSFRLLHLLPDCDEKSFGCIDEGLSWIHDSFKKNEKLINLRIKASSSYEMKLKKISKALEEEEARFESFQNADRHKHLGDLITSVINNIKPGTLSVSVYDWEAEKEISIDLLRTLSPSKNAERYYKLYKKSKRGSIETRKRIEELSSERKWLEEQLWYIKTAETPVELENIIPEKKKDSGKKQDSRKKQDNNQRESRKARLIKPTYEIDGCRFYVGKNCRHNELITFGVAAKNDLWAHAVDVPGCHVIAKKLDGKLTDADSHRAAVLAARFSFAGNSSKVAVDITLAGNVHRIPGGLPGRVYYTQQKTLHVNPAEADALII
ncbi:MAG: NFACT family protein [Candidatus Riflebacteria bacterium]|nr:NFACT family protein [Candidatus Riflebacteria bacterium]